MASSLLQSVLCPTLIGRAAQLAALTDLLTHVGAHGRAPQPSTTPHVALITGEAGIGKSRLVAEAKAIAVQRGMIVLQGRCFEQDRTFPYAPILDMLRAFCARHSADELAHVFNSVAPELVKIFPELSAFIPNLAPSPAFDPEQEKRRLFQALAQWLATVSAHIAHTGAPPRPLLIIIEDLHWCDDLSLEFLLYLTRQLTDRPWLLLLTYRNDELTPALQHTLSTLDRARLANEFSLSRLTMNEVEMMMRAIFDLTTMVRGEFLQPIYALTEGNPFFVEEVLKALVSAGDIFMHEGAWSRKPMAQLHIPRSVQDAVQRRTTALSEVARQLLAVAAVAGRQFDFAVLPLLTQHDERTLLQLIRELIAAQLVIEESAEKFAFRHALTRQAIYNDLLVRERKTLHRAICEAIEQVYAASLDGQLAALAYHSDEAGLWDKARLYGQRAGEQAQNLYAPQAAVEHYTRAIRASAQLDQAPDWQLRRARGQMYQQLGAFDAARADYEAVLADGQRRDDPQVEWQALVDLGFLWVARDYARAGEYFQRALARAHDMADSAPLAHTLNRVGNWHLNLDRPFEALRYHEEALRIFESLQDRQGVAATLDLMGITNYITNDILAAVAQFGRAVALFRELDERGGLLSSLSIMAPRHMIYINNIAVWPRVELAVRVRDGEEAVQLARTMGARPAEALALIWSGLNLATAGEYARGLVLTRQGLVLAEEIGHTHLIAVANMVLGTLAWDIFDWENARTYLERAQTLMRETASLAFLGAVSAFLALTHLQQNDLKAAEVVLEQYALTTTWATQTMSQRQLWCTRAEVCLARGDAAQALTIIENLIHSAPNIAAHGVHAIPRLTRLRGEALLALARMAEAEEMLKAACVSAQACDNRPMLWRAQASLARMYYAERRRAEAEAQSTEARAIIMALADAMPEAALRAQFIEHAQAQLPSLPQPTLLRAAKQAADGLTAREREVATLIAQGKSNRAIADELVLSERTIAKHVENIMSKLNFASRAQVAAWVVERGRARKSKG